VSESLGERKLSELCPCPSLNVISRSSDKVSLKRDERGRNIKKSCAGETALPKTVLVQGILAQASHVLLKRDYHRKFLVWFSAYLAQARKLIFRRKFGSFTEHKFLPLFTIEINLYSLNP